MTSEYAKVRPRPLRLTATAVSGAPVRGVTAPHVRLSYYTPDGARVTGIMFMIDSVLSTAPETGPFTVTPWILWPVTGLWTNLASASVARDTAYTSFDVPGGCAMYLQIATGTSGVFACGLAEQG